MYIANGPGQIIRDVTIEFDRTSSTRVFFVSLSFTQKNTAIIRGNQIESIISNSYMFETEIDLTLNFECEEN